MLSAESLVVQQGLRSGRQVQGDVLEWRNQTWPRDLHWRLQKISQVWLFAKWWHSGILEHTFAPIVTTLLDFNESESENHRILCLAHCYWKARPMCDRSFQDCGGRKSILYYGSWVWEESTVSIPTTNCSVTLYPSWILSRILSVLYCPENVLTMPGEFNAELYSYIIALFLLIWKNKRKQLKRKGWCIFCSSKVEG